MITTSPEPMPVPASPPRRLVVVSMEHAARLFPDPEATRACDEALTRHGGAVVAVVSGGVLTFEPLDNGVEISNALDTIEGVIMFQFGNEAKEAPVCPALGGSSILPAQH